MSARGGRRQRAAAPASDAVPPARRRRRSSRRGSTAPCTCGGGTARTPPCPTRSTWRSTGRVAGQPVAPRPLLATSTSPSRTAHRAAVVGTAARRARRPLAGVAPAGGAASDSVALVRRRRRHRPGHGVGRARHAVRAHRTRAARRPLGPARRRRRSADALGELAASMPPICLPGPTTRPRSPTSTPPWSTASPATASPTAAGGRTCRRRGRPADGRPPAPCSAPSPHPTR